DLHSKNRRVCGPRRTSAPRDPSPRREQGALGGRHRPPLRRHETGDLAAPARPEGGRPGDRAPRRDEAVVPSAPRDHRPALGLPRGLLVRESAYAEGRRRARRAAEEVKEAWPSTRKSLSG